MTTILTTKPQLSIQSSNDGVWLHFSTSDGKRHSSINLSVIFDRENLSDLIIVEWCKEYATKEALSPLTKPEDEKK